MLSIVTAVLVHWMVKRVSIFKHPSHELDLRSIKVHWLIERGSKIKHGVHVACRLGVPVCQRLVEIRKAKKRVLKVSNIINTPVAKHGTENLACCRVCASVLVVVFYGVSKTIAILPKAAAICFKIVSPRSALLESIRKLQGKSEKIEKLQSGGGRADHLSCFGIYYGYSTYLQGSFSASVVVGSSKYNVSFV
jgi:hypothetical protein